MVAGTHRHAFKVENGADIVGMHTIQGEREDARLVRSRPDDAQADDAANYGGIGSVIGHEIGDNRAGTAVGAVVGGVAGHQIERQARMHKRYDITVRMNDGSTRAFSVAARSTMPFPDTTTP